MAKANTIAELRQIYTVLEIEVGDEELASMTEKDCEKEIDKLSSAAGKVAEKNEQIAARDDLLADVMAKKPVASTSTVPAQSTGIPDYKPVKRLTIRKLRGGSGITQILSKYTDRDNRPTQLRLAIKFPDDLKLIWDSEKHAGEISPTVINFYGGKENVLGIIKARIEEIEKRSPGEYEIIDTNKMDLILAEEDIVKYSEDEIKKAIEDPNSPEAKSLFDFFKARRGAANVPVAATVVR
jgi:hypothetical protein